MSATTDKQEAIQVYQRRAVYTVLLRWLPESDALEATKVFIDFYQGQGHELAREFIEQIRVYWQGRVDPHVMRRALMASLLRRSTELAADPLPLLQGSRAEVEEEPAFRLHFMEPTDAQRALHQVIQTIIAPVGGSMRVEFETALAREMKHVFNNGSYEKLVRYTLEGDVMQLVGMKPEALQRYLSCLYKALCSAAGPVATDQRFSTAMQALPQHQRRSIDSFL